MLDFIINFSDYIIPSLTGAAGFFTNSYLKKKEQRQKELERERGFLDEYVAIFVEYEQGLMRAVDKSNYDLRSDQFWEEFQANFKVVNVHSKKESELEIKSDLVNKVNNILMKEYEDDYDYMIKQKKDFLAQKGTSKDTPKQRAISLDEMKKFYNEMFDGYKNRMRALIKIYF